MRALCTFSVLLLLPLAAACGADADGSPVMTDQRCQQAWGTVGRLHGDSGDPEGSFPELGKLWERLDARATDLAAHATAADCGADMADFVNEWQGLDQVMAGLAEYDAPHQLVLAERDLRHYRELHPPGPSSSQLPEEVQRAFVTLRHEAPLALDGLSRVLGEAGTGRFGREGAAEAYLDRVKQAWQGNTHAVLVTRALRVIGDAELGEE